VAYVLADESFSLCLGTVDDFFYTQSSRNADRKDHALVFLDPNAAGYIVAWEDLWNLGDVDYQDLVMTGLTPVKVNVYYCPKTLNLESEGRWIMATIRLPKGYNASDVDVSSLLLNGTVPADLKHHVAIDCGGMHILIVKFDWKAVIELIRNSLGDAGCRVKSVGVSLTANGRFLNGFPFQGTNSITIIHFSCCPKSKGAIGR